MNNMKERLSHETIALRCVKEFRDGDCINLGIGIPNLCAVLMPPEIEIHLHSEQGVLGYGRLLRDDEYEKADRDYVDAGGRFFLPQPGMCFFDMDLSFDLVRGGHLDVAVLGGLQVSKKGDLANWAIETKSVTGNIGGGMDIAVGAKKVIIAMTHTSHDGKPKIVNECTLPLTAKECVDLLVTDLAVIEVTEHGLLLKEIAPGWIVEEVQALTEPELAIADDLKEIEL